MIATRIFTTGLAALGVSAMAIGGGIFLFGPAAVADAFARLLAALGADSPAVSGLSNANADSELRFYSALWIAFGALAINTALRLPCDVVASRRRANVLLAVFFLGGIGRAISHMTIGAPHPLFSLLMWIELAAPTALFLLSLRLQDRPAP